MRRPFVPASPEEAEAHREDLAYGAGARAWDMDPGRHTPADEPVTHRFSGKPVPTGGGGRYAWKWPCDHCGAPMPGFTEADCRLRAARHVEGGWGE